MKEITQAIAATSEIMGREISPIACAMMAKKLAEFPKPLVMQALDEVSEGNGFLTLEAVKSAMERIQPDGRPSADEAWAMIPRDEYTTAMLTDEMQSALHIAQPLLNEGDQIAARMAFKQAYERLVGENKRAGIKPKWNISMGWDAQGREPVLAEAVRLGRIKADYAIKLLPPERAAPMLELAGEEKLALEYKPESKEHGLKMLEEIKNKITLKMTEQPKELA